MCWLLCHAINCIMVLNNDAFTLFLLCVTWFTCCVIRHASGHMHIINMHTEIHTYVHASMQALIVLLC